MIARDLMELFQLLAVDSGPFAEYGFLAAGDVEEHSDGHLEFLTWLDRNFGIEPPEDLDALWNGRRKTDDRFRAWASRFVELLDDGQ
ncbi:hypothetical protein GCM10029992_13780 [Glycomyces albus]